MSIQAPPLTGPQRVAFPTYLEMHRRVPVLVWRILGVISIAAYLATAVTLFVRPAKGLLIFWGVAIPSLPLLFFAAPGIWRNVCPLANFEPGPHPIGLHEGVLGSAVDAKARAACRGSGLLRPHRVS